MKDQVTTIEQSKRLMALGVPAEKASMVWTSFQDSDTLATTQQAHDDDYYVESSSIIKTPAYTVADLLGVMPEDIVCASCNYSLTLRRGIAWNLRYENIRTHQCVFEYLHDDLVASLYSCMEWLVSNGYKLDV